MKRTIIAVIPARLQSRRLPRKVLLPLAGRPLLEHVWRRVRRCKAIDAVYIATDSKEVASAVQKFGGDVIMTSKTCPSGTDRVAEALDKTKDSGRYSFSF